MSYGQAVFGVGCRRRSALRYGRGRYKRNQEGDCQYKGVLIGSLIGIAFAYKEIVLQ